MDRLSFRAPSANLAALVLGALCLLGAAPTGAIFVTTLPAGADVWLDGTYLGRSPVVVDALAAGEHRLSLNRTGWSPQDLSVSVVPAQTAASSIVLTRDRGKSAVPKGRIVVHGLPAGTAVKLDGGAVRVASGGTIAAPAGTHQLAFSAEQGKSTLTVTVYPDTRTDVVVPAEGGRRSVVIAPADDYLPASAYHLEGTRLSVHFGGHDVIGRMGTKEYQVDKRTASYDSAPMMIGTRLYLPLELLTMLTANEKK